MRPPPPIRMSQLLVTATAWRIFMIQQKYFLLWKCWKVIFKLDFRVDTRLPITLPILKRILKVSSSTASSPYRACLFNAMCATAFFSFLRIGEVTTTPQSSSVMQLSQVSKLVDDAGLTAWRLPSTILSIPITNAIFQSASPAEQICVQFRFCWTTSPSGATMMAHFFTL